jgi:hypothetical protein
MRRNLDLLVSLVLLATIAACSGGSDGRPPTTVAGNVRSAAAASTARGPARLWQSALAWWHSVAVAQIPGITVAIVNSSTATTTDEQGFFRLEGNHFGPSVVQFAGGGADAQLAVTLPAGGELDLIDVDLRGSQITVAEQRIHFDGPVTGIDCQGNLLQVLSGEQVPFRVRLQASTAIVDQDGAPLRCVDLLPGRAADVQGTVNSDGDVLALSLRLNPGPNAAPTPSTFEGSVAALQCPASITLARAQGNVQVNIGSGTVVREANGDTLQCSDLLGGDTVEVEGTENSFGISASSIERVAPAPTPTPSPTL